MRNISWQISEIFLKKVFFFFFKYFILFWLTFIHKKHFYITLVWINTPEVPSQLWINTKLYECVLFPHTQNNKATQWRTSNSFTTQAHRHLTDSSVCVCVCSCLGLSSAHHYVSLPLDSAGEDETAAAGQNCRWQNAHKNIQRVLLRQTWL